MFSVFIVSIGLLYNIDRCILKGWVKTTWSFLTLLYALPIIVDGSKPTHCLAIIVVKGKKGCEKARSDVI